MAVLVKFLLACLLCSQVTWATNAIAPHAVLPSHQGLAHLFFTSRTTARNPQISMACFSDYISHSNFISSSYSSDYSDCLVTATNTRNEVDLEITANRKDIVTSADGVCKRLNTCSELNSTLGLFNCHANAGVNNTKATYAISGNASEFATLLQERYRTIELNYDKCCHAAERVYVADTANNYNHLQACLDGRVQPRPPPTTTTSSTTTTTTTTTTEAPPPPPEPTTTPEGVTENHEGIQEQFAQLLNMLN